MSVLARGTVVFWLILAVTSSYIEMPLIRYPSSGSTPQGEPQHCRSANASSSDYSEVCYLKDIAYSIPFIFDDAHFSLSADFTTPLSWVKGEDCRIEGTHKRCKRSTETVIEKIKEHRKGRLHREEGEGSAVIDGPSGRVRGQLQKDKSVALTVKDSNRLNNLLELIMLGLFIYGERDNLTLTRTNFINAKEITANLNELSDGAISLRFDNTAENSFLEEIFTYADALEKSVTIYLSSENIITIGDLTARNTDKGYSGITWVDLPSDTENQFGRLPQLTSIGIGDVQQDREEDTDESLSAVLTLGASYLSFPEEVINKAILAKIGKEAVCKVNSHNFFECASTSQKKLKRLLEKNMVIGLKGANLIIPLEKLLLKDDHGKRAVFKIKKSIGKYAILGEPIFLQYFLAFDYLGNRIGFSGKREEINEIIFQIVPLVRFLCCMMLFGCCFICCYEPCSQITRRAGRVKRDFRRQRRREREESQSSEQNSQGYNQLAETGRNRIFDDSICQEEED